MERSELMTIKYENDDSDLDSLDLRELGNSLIGLDKIVENGIWVTGLHAAPPKRRTTERLFRIEGTEIRRGCIELGVLIASGSAFGSLFSDYYYSLAAKIAGNWLKVSVQERIFNVIGRKNSNGDPLVNQLMEDKKNLMNMMLEDKRMMYEDAKDQRKHMETLINNVLESQHKSVKEFVSPVGSSCNYIVVPMGSDSFAIDEGMVSRIRDKEQVTYEPEVEVWVKVNGITRRTKQLKVIPEGFQDRLVTAFVDDPEFKEDFESNKYLQAIAFKGELQVSGMFARDPQGNIKHMRIMKILGTSRF